MADNSLSATRTLFVVADADGNWISISGDSDYSCFISEAEAEDARYSEADSRSQPESTFTILRFDRAALSVESGEGTPQPNQDQLREAGELLERLRIQAIQKAENDGGRLTLSPEKYSAVEDKFWRSIASFCMASLAVARESTAPRKDTATAPITEKEKR